MPPWNVPDLAYYYDTLKFSMKESLNAFLRSEKKNPDVVWDQIEDALRVVLLANEPKLIEVTERLGGNKTTLFCWILLEIVFVDSNRNGISLK